jgi:hypothetical protein
MTPFDTEWLNQNHFRAYPIREDATLQSADGYVLPNEIILDLILVSFPTAKLPLYVSQVTVTNGICEVRIADSDGMVVTSVVVDATLHTDPKAYNITGLNDYANIRGRIVLGDLAGAAKKGTGTHLFTSAATRLLDTCVLPSTSRVESLAAMTADGDVSTGLIGAVQLKAGTNIRLSPLVSENAIQIDSVPMEVDCSCNDPFCGFEKPISRVNGIGADESCNVNLRGIGCIQVTAQNNTIFIEDTCYEPCNSCCDQLKSILQQITELESAYALQGNTSDPGNIPGTAMPYIYDIAREKGKVCKFTKAVGPSGNQTSYYSTMLVDGTQGCPPKAIDSYLVAAHNKSASEAEAAGLYVVNDKGYLTIEFNVKNEGLSGSKGFVIDSTLKNSLAAMGFVVVQSTYMCLIGGQFDFNKPFFRTPEVAATGCVSFPIRYCAPQQYPPPGDGAGVTYYEHWVYIMLRGYPGFPTV